MEEKQSFWEHLDLLRTALIRIAAVTTACATVAFILKDGLFSIVLAPCDNSFITYRWLESLGNVSATSSLDKLSVQIINTGLASQFLIHMRTAIWAGVICASPYIIYQAFRFVSPALYDKERSHAVSVVVSGYVMFALGLLTSYFIIFPLTFRFLGTYQVSSDVPNMITLDSYISTLTALSLAIGIIFEMPAAAWLLAKIGLITSGFMRQYRRHAVVAILIVAAVITPTADILTLSVVSLPMILLYELSILIVKIHQTRK